MRLHLLGIRQLRTGLRAQGRVSVRAAVATVVVQVLASVSVLAVQRVGSALQVQVVQVQLRNAQIHGNGRARKSPNLFLVYGR